MGFYWNRWVIMDLTMFYKSHPPSRTKTSFFIRKSKVDVMLNALSRLGLCVPLCPYYFNEFYCQEII